jgi:hypothetical protein
VTGKLVSFLFLHSMVRILGSPTKVSGQKRLRILYKVKHWVKYRMLILWRIKLLAYFLTQPSRTVAFVTLDGHRLMACCNEHCSGCYILFFLCEIMGDIWNAVFSILFFLFFISVVA